MFIWRFVRLLFLFTFALPGVLLNLPAGIVIDIRAKQKAKEALATSNVKIKAKDVIGTWKVLIGIVLIPLLYLIYAGIIAVLVVFLLPDLEFYWKIVIPVGSLLVLPWISYFSIRFFEISSDLWFSLKPLLWSMFGKGTDLRVKRQKIAQDVKDLVNELGPKLFDNFDEMQESLEGKKRADSWADVFVED